MINRCPTNRDTLHARYDHDAYGNPTRTLTAATPELDAATAAVIAERNILRYAGYAFDEHSGLYYLSQRYYDPVTCQFITKGPAKADGEESAYQYCGGDPVGKVDPSGEWSWPVKWTVKHLSIKYVRYQRYRNTCHSGSGLWYGWDYVDRVTVYFKRWILDAVMLPRFRGQSSLGHAGLC